MGEVYALIARPWDTTAQDIIPAPPWPFGANSVGFDSSLDFAITGKPTAVYASAGAGGFRSRSTDTPASTLFPPRLLKVLSYQARMFEGSEPSPRTRPGFGTIEVDNTDGIFDTWFNLGFDGRPIELWRGDNTAAFSTFVNVFTGTCDGLEKREDRIIFRLRDRDLVFDTVINLSVFAGTGGSEGTTNIQGRPRPLAFGVLRNLEPLQIDPNFLVYQWHDSLVMGPTEVRDKGVPITYSGVDVGTYEGLIGLTITPGQYATCNAKGMIRLGASPVGGVTLDGQGDAGGGYVSTTADIIQRIVTNRLGLKSIKSADLLGVAAFNVDQPGAIGIYITQATTAAQVLDSLLQGAGAWGSFTLAGKYQIAVFKAPATSVVTYTRAQLGTPLVQTFPRQTSQRRGGYARVWRVQSPSDLVQPPAITETNRQFWGQPIRYSTAADNSVDLKHLLADQRTIDAYFDQQSVADAEVQRQLVLFGAERSYTTYQIDGADPLSRALGETITLNPGAVKFVIVGMTVEVETNTLQLELWK